MTLTHSVEGILHQSMKETAWGNGDVLKSAIILVRMLVEIASCLVRKVGYKCRFPRCLKTNYFHKYF